MKYDSTGSVLWTSQQGSSSNDYGYGVAVSGDGFIYITGYTYGGSLNGQSSSQGRQHFSYNLSHVNFILLR